MVPEGHITVGIYLGLFLAQEVRVGLCAGWDQMEGLYIVFL